MTPTEPRYDLVFFGTELQGAQRADAMAKLAQLMRVSPDQVGAVLRQKDGVIARGLPSDTGTEAQRKLMAIGIRCNLRPSGGSDSALELVPMEAPATVTACPACGHIHPVAEGDASAPEACEKCGVVFAKYDKVALEKKEREQIRRALLAKQHDALDREQKERELREAQERRKKLEEDIRRELGLPRVISSPGRLIGSAAGLYMLGLAMGVAGVFGYDALLGNARAAAELWPSALTADAAAGLGVPGGPGAMDPTGALENAAAGGQEAFDPGMVAQMQVANLLAAASDMGGPEGGSALTEMSDAAAGVSSPGGDAASALAADPAGPGAEVGALQDRQFLGSRLADLKTDREWDLYLLGRIDDLSARGATEQAAALVDYLRNPVLRFDRGGGLVAGLLRDGRSEQAGALKRHLIAAADRQSDTGGSRVAAFCALAHRLNLGGRPAEADELLREATTIASAISGPADKAAADIEIAALLTNLGRSKDARAYFVLANGGLGRIADPADRLSTVAWVAGGYAKAGYRASALSLLEEGADHIDLIEGTEERARVLAAIAETEGRVGDIQAARETAARIASQTAKDRILYRLVAAEIASDRLANAIDLTEGLQTPTYRALAFALLGLRQQDQPAYRGLATRSTEQATAAIAEITDSAEKAAVSAELGRYAAHRGDKAAADRYLAEGYQLAESSLSAPDRDRALAILAINEGLALRPADARLKLPQIADAPLRLAVASELRALDDAARAAGP